MSNELFPCFGLSFLSSNMGHGQVALELSLMHVLGGGEKSLSQVSSPPQEDSLPQEAGSITGSRKEKEINREKMGAKEVESRSGQLDSGLLGRDQVDGNL